MSLITWTKEQFGTNVSKHDQEHQTIFGMLNALHTAVAAGDRKTVGAQLDALIAFVAEHFASEEDNMTRHGFASVSAHKAAHDELVARCVDLQEKFHAGQAEITPQVTAFVRDWLLNHVPNVDRQYGPFLNAKGVA